MLEIDPPSDFASKDAEVRYWMDVAYQMYQRKEEVERDMIEFHENSQLYEKELETSCEQAERRNRDLCVKNEKLTIDNEQLRVKLSQRVAAEARLQAELQELERRNDQLVICVRKLEQKNDDLERANRESKVAEEELEMQFNTVLEKLALLETDVDEREALKVAVQRLKDENTDLKQQIQIELRQQTGDADVRRSVRYRNNRDSTTSNALRLMGEQSQRQYNQNSDLLEYVRELEQKVESLENAERISQLSREDLASKFNMAVEKIALLESELDEKANYQAIIQKLKDENTLLSQEVEVRLRTHKGKTLERTRSHSIKLPDDRPGALSRHIESRVKKVKEEEKRQQNLMWFLRRLRHSQPNWMRKKEHD